MVHLTEVTSYKIHTLTPDCFQSYSHLSNKMSWVSLIGFSDFAPLKTEIPSFTFAKLPPPHGFYLLILQLLHPLLFYSLQLGY